MHFREHYIRSPLLPLSLLLLFLINFITLFTIFFTLLFTPRSSPQPAFPTRDQHPSLSGANTSTCRFPLVYNKPHKTGSTTVQRALSRWAKDQNRTFFSCSSFTSTASMQLRECIKSEPSGCAVVATHIVLDPTTRVLLTERIGPFKLLTSTRRPRSRILSAFLQRHATTAGVLGEEEAGLLRKYVDSFNPWSLYIYHTGKFREGTCPLSKEGRLAVEQLAKTFDVVVDVDLMKHSEAILEHWGLSRLEGIRVNTRGSGEVVVPEDVERKLKQVSCVEDELHRLLRLRMASLYEKATGESCLLQGRQPKTCFPENS